MAKQEAISLRKHLADLLDMKGAHLTLDAVLSNFPVHLRGAKPPRAPHSAWQLLDHMRNAQEDILDFSRNPNYRDKKLCPPLNTPQNAHLSSNGSGPLFGTHTCGWSFSMPLMWHFKPETFNPAVCRGSARVSGSTVCRTPLNHSRFYSF